jgi:RNA polymerase sigma-70 factor, ECF subfamily
VSVAEHGPRASFDALYQQHRHRVYAWALRYAGGNRAWAEDVTQDVFVRLFEHLDAMEADVGGWLYRVTANLAISRIRRRSTLTRLLGTFGAPFVARPRAPDEHAELKGYVTQAEQFLAKLPVRERAVLAMYLLDGMNQKEIGEVLSLSKGYVSKLLARARVLAREAGWELGDDEADT